MNDRYDLATYIRSFFEDHLVRRRNLSRNSVWSYRDVIKLLIQFVADRTGKSVSLLQVTDINESLVLEFLKHLERKRGNSIQTCNQRLVTVRSLFEYIAFREPLLMEHCKRITTIPLKRGALIPQIGYLTRDEMQGILEAVDRTSWTGQRDYVLLLYMYNTGSRVQEVADARISWLSLDSPYKVQIVDKGNKSRICPLWENTAKALKHYIREQNSVKCNTDHLFLNRCRMPLSRSGIAYIVDSWARKASRQIQSLKNNRITPHTLRHTTAMHLLQSGVEINVIKNWLGHASITTTDRYVQIDLDMKTRALETCDITRGQRCPGRRHFTPQLLTWLESL
jgi:site-specific recombinase XerD